MNFGLGGRGPEMPGVGEGIEGEDALREEVVAERLGAGLEEGAAVIAGEGATGEQAEKVKKAANGVSRNTVRKLIGKIRAL